MGLFVRLRCVVTANKIKLLFVLAGLPLATVCHAQRAEQIEDWHNLPILAARTGQAHAWTREFDAADKGWSWGMQAEGRVVLVYSAEKIIALDSASGKTLWTQSPIAKGLQFRDVIDFFRTVEVAGQIVIYGNTSDKALLFALDIRTGKVTWQRSLTSYLNVVKAAGSDLVCEQTIRAKMPISETQNLFILNAKTGREKCVLSLTDEAANRVLLKQNCPALLDQYVLFGDALTRNGILLAGHSWYGVQPQSWVYEGMLYQRTEYEDFPMDLGSMSALCELKKISLTTLNQDNAAPADLWNGRAQGRNYHFANCTYFGPVVGPCRGRLLATLTSKNTSINEGSAISTVVSVPLDGPFAAEPIETPFAIDHFLKRGRTSVGYLFEGSPEISPGRYGTHVVLITDKSAIAQPQPPDMGDGYLDWDMVQPCTDGILYYSRTDLARGAGKQKIHMEPYVVR